MGVLEGESEQLKRSHDNDVNQLISHGGLSLQLKLLT
jgi:hypothetical protein